MPLQRGHAVPRVQSFAPPRSAGHDAHRLEGHGRHEVRIEALMSLDRKGWFYIIAAAVLVAMLLLHRQLWTAWVLDLELNEVER
jgi:hypothetical protein